MEDERLAKKKEYRKQYREQNKEKHRQSVKTWIENHREQRRELKRKSQSKRRRGLDFIPLNEWFEGSDAHHIDKTYVIYIPKEVHQSIYHSVLKNINMDEINAMAFNYLEI